MNKNRIVKFLRGLGNPLIDGLLKIMNDKRIV